MSHTELFIHDVEDLDVKELRYLEQVKKYSRCLVVKDSGGGEVILSLLSNSPSSLIFLDDLVIGEKK